MLPNMTVVVPADYNQTLQATLAIAAWDGPVYLRFGRPSVPIFTPEDAVFQIGKADLLVQGTDVTIIACGHMVWKALEAQVQLEEQGISAEVINMHTIKPLDTEAILNSVAKTGCVVTAEEHMMNGGLGDAVAQVLSKNSPAPQEFVAVNDTFGESGTPNELLKKYHLETTDIVLAAERVLARKN
jgi:transketolase